VLGFGRAQIQNHSTRTPKPQNLKFTNKSWKRFTKVRLGFLGKDQKKKEIKKVQIKIKIERYRDRKRNDNKYFFCHKKWPN
jgi:hypothetical protein